MSSRLRHSNLDRELARRGWTANDLAVASGVSAATISSARHGRPMRHKTLYKIADALVKAPIVAGVDVLLETSIAEGPDQPRGEDRSCRVKASLKLLSSRRSDIPHLRTDFV